MGTIIMNVISAPFRFLGFVLDAVVEARQLQADLQAKRYVEEFQNRP
jgi:hypothetical protein